MATKPINKALYMIVKREADEKFLALTSVYKSSWIVREYKKRGGLYENNKPNKDNGLKRWFLEKWVDLNRDGKPCGRPSSNEKGKYPLCRPTIRVSSNTPVTVSELNGKAQIKEANQQKQKIKNFGHVKPFVGKKK